MKLVPGASYRVLVSAALSGWETVSQHGGAFHERGTSRKLAVGDVVVFARHGYSGGSDGITVPFFKLADGYEGTLWPSGPYGDIKAGTLELVVKEPVKAKGAK